MSEDVEFELFGTVLRGKIFFPDEPGPHPLVIVHSGFGSVAEGHLDLAPSFTDAGLAVLFYDHRGYGYSDGQPRQRIDPWQFALDLRDVITLVGERPDVDQTRIGAWGISLGGMIALIVAGTDRRLAAVVSIIPPISGSGARKLFPPAALEHLDAAIEADRREQLHGGDGVLLQVSGERVAGGPDVLFDDAEGAEFVQRYQGRPSFRNEVMLSSMSNLFALEVGVYAERVTAPLFMVLATEDTIAPVKDARDFYARVPGEKELVEYPGQHYAILLSRYHAIAELTGKWLGERLSRR